MHKAFKKRKKIVPSENEIEFTFKVLHVTESKIIPFHGVMHFQCFFYLQIYCHVRKVTWNLQQGKRGKISVFPSGTYYYQIPWVPRLLVHWMQHEGFLWPFEFQKAWISKANLSNHINANNISLEEPTGLETQIAPQSLSITKIQLHGCESLSIKYIAPLWKHLG